MLDARWLMAFSAGLGETDARYYDTQAERLLVHPMFPVCYEWPLADPLRTLPSLKPHYPRLLHAQHDLTLHRAPRPGDRLRTAARIVGVAQRRPGAFVLFRFDTRDADGMGVSTTDFGALYRGVTVEGGDRLPPEGLGDPPPCEERLPRIGELFIGANAGHVYTECARIWNPIHTDVAYARAAGLPGIILHGTATLALSISRALAASGTDPARVRRVQCRFAGMVPMPCVLTVHAVASGKTIRFETRDVDGHAVLTRGVLSLS